jgi:hypothetical protein
MLAAKSYRGGLYSEKGLLTSKAIDDGLYCGKLMTVEALTEKASRANRASTLAAIAANNSVC